MNMTQTTFIPGRNILEGVVILHEAMHELRRKKQKRVVLKLDFEKAYDKISWHFLLEVLERKKFPKKWIKWIKDVISGGRVRIKINGEAGNF
jgi:type VI protein secretion system component Hcp